MEKQKVEKNTRVVLLVSMKHKYTHISVYIYIKHKCMVMTRKKNEERLIISNLSVLQFNLHNLLPVFVLLSLKNNFQIFSNI